MDIAEKANHGNKDWPASMNGRVKNCPAIRCASHYRMPDVLAIFLRTGVTGISAVDLPRKCWLDLLWLRALFEADLHSSLSAAWFWYSQVCAVCRPCWEMSRTASGISTLTRGNAFTDAQPPGLSAIRQWRPTFPMRYCLSVSLIPVIGWSVWAVFPSTICMRPVSIRVRWFKQALKQMPPAVILLIPPFWCGRTTVSPIFRSLSGYAAPWSWWIFGLLRFIIIVEMRETTFFSLNWDMVRWVYLKFQAFATPLMHITIFAGTTDRYAFGNEIKIIQNVN